MCIRDRIDELLSLAGWVLQNPDQFDRKAGLGVAVREFQLQSGPCDYLVLVDGKAAGVIEAVNGLEQSLSTDQPRSLIQLATGAGKTFTACTFSYRLIKHAAAQGILFLVDRNNLGDQTLKEYQNFRPPGTANRFTDTYIVQHLQSKHIDKDAKVVITTIQRLYAMLPGEELPPEADEGSAYETWQDEEGDLRPIEYNPGHTHRDV